MKVWISKWVFTEGLIEENAQECGDDTIRAGQFGIHFRGEGKEWHRTKEDAIRCAEEMRVKRIASLEKQIAKLKKMKFE